MAQTTDTFRKYGERSEYLVVDTRPVSYCQLLGRNVPNDVTRIARLSRDTARELGTALIGWTASPLTSANHTFESDRNAPLPDGATGCWPVSVNIEDGTNAVNVGGIGTNLTQEQAQDVGQRLIAWAGVQVPVDA